jgi:hypothetical protein
MQSIFNVETYIRKTLYEQCHKKFSNKVSLPSVPVLSESSINET